MKKIIIFIALIVSLIMISVFFILKGNITGFAITKTDDFLKKYTYTKAICNETNFCQDYEITCNGTELMNSMPLTGAVVQHSEGWKDPRNETALCKN